MGPTFKKETTTIGLLQAPYRNYRYLTTREGRLGKKNIHLHLKNDPLVQIKIFGFVKNDPPFFLPGLHCIFDHLLNLMDTSTKRLCCIFFVFFSFHLRDRPINVTSFFNISY